MEDEYEDDDESVTMDDLWEEYGPDAYDEGDDDNWDTAARYDD